MNKNNTISLLVGSRLGNRWNLVIMPIFKERKDTKAINRFESVEEMVIPSGHHGHIIFPKEKERIDDK